MPHLSPMKWCIMLFMFWLILSLLSTMLWWNQLPTWQPMQSSSINKMMTWKW